MVKENLDDLMMRAIYDDDFRRELITTPQKFMIKYNLSEDDFKLMKIYDLDKVKSLVDELSEIDYTDVVAAAWCNMTTPVRENMG